MSIYIVGDIHGSHEALTDMLNALEFRKWRDRLWCVGDVVNRGPDSAACIQTLQGLGRSARCVMGNHELLLLACAWGIVSDAPEPLAELLRHPEADSLLNWVRRLPFVIHDRLRALLVVHAGLPPHWSLGDVRRQAARLHRIIVSSRGPQFLREAFDMSHNSPELLYGEDGSSPHYALHALTMMRRCGPAGELVSNRDEYDAGLDDEFEPWFNYRRPGREARTTHYLFGHWAGLNGVDRPYLHGLDTGCVRGGTLTAYEAGADRLHHVSCDQLD